MPFKVLITCPPMLRAIDRFRAEFERRGIEITTPNVTQILSEAELLELVPQFDGWIIGDDPATRKVFTAGKAGKLKAAVKWGVGMDNVDFAACKDLGIPISNTPGMFGKEVADIAIGYVVALARQTFVIDRGVKAGQWLKPAGQSLSGQNVALVGFGDIGRNTAKRLLACEMNVVAYDPFFAPAPGLEAVQSATWPDRIAEADFVVITCALTPANRHLINASTLAAMKPGVRIVNVSRGPLINETDLAAALASSQVHSAAMEVMETEPLPSSSALRAFGDRVLFGSHNASNTIQAVNRTSQKAIELLTWFLYR
jgi:D-3-phosphoglycerate dehydrogenase